MTRQFLFLCSSFYMPEGASQPPLIVWVHGGAWRRGSKDGMPLDFLVASGYAVASVDYRLSPVVRPAATVIHGDQDSQVPMDQFIRAQARAPSD